MNVLLLFEYPTLCGGEQSLLALLPRLRVAGCRFRAACPPQGPLAEALRGQDVEVLPLTLHGQAGVRLPLDQCRGELAVLLRRCSPDLLHSNSLSTSRLAGPVAADLGVPSIGHLRDIVGLSRRAVSDVNRHRRLLAVSRALREFHVAQGIDPTRTTVLYNGVDLAAFRPREPTGYLHRELGLPAESLLLGSIGQLSYRKGTDLFLAAAGQIAASWRQAQFLVIGRRLSGKAESLLFEQALHQTAGSDRMAGRVHFLDWRADVPAILPELTVLVHSARQEPLGRVLLEGAAAGRPIVATLVGGTPEIFPEPNEAAVLVPANDPEALAAALLELGGDKDRRASLGQAARSRMESAFGAERAAAELIKQYSSAV